MPAAVMAAAFEHIGKALKVGVHIGLRILKRIAHAGLRGEMHDVGKFFRLEQCRNGGAIGEIKLDEAEAVVAFKLLQAGVLERGIVIEREIVDADHRPPTLQQAPRHLRADEAGRASHQHKAVAHGRHRSGPIAKPKALKMPP